MQYIKKIPKENESITNNLLKNGWKPLKEPKSVGIATLLSLPISFVLFFLECYYLYYLSSDFKMLTTSLETGIEINIFKIPLFIVALIAFFLLHEFVHALFTPNIFKSKKIFWGFNGLYGFVYSEEPISKKRFIVVALVPLMILSIILPTVLNTMGILNNFVNFL